MTKENIIKNFDKVIEILEESLKDITNPQLDALDILGRMARGELDDRYPEDYENGRTGALSDEEMMELYRKQVTENNNQN